MKCPLNVNMPMKKPLSIGFVALLILAMAIGVTATPWDGDPDDPTPAQAIWVDPQNTTGLGIGDDFVVDILVNVTDPPGAAKGMFGFQYKLKWDLRVLDAVEIQTHTDKIPTTDLLPGWASVFVAANATGTVGGWNYHAYAVSALKGSTAFTGVASLCTYRFQLVKNRTCTLDIYDDILAADIPGEVIPHTTVDGYYITGYPVAIFTYSPEYPFNETVTFDATDSYDLEGPILNYTWNFDDGTPIVNETDPITTHNFTAFGAYNVTLTVTDNDGLTDTAWQIVKVGTVAIFTWSPEFPLPGQTVTFDARGSHAAYPPIVNYTWNFGDGTPIVNETDPFTTHSYTAFGTYNVTLTVTDNASLTDSTWDLITVWAKPIADFTWSPEEPKVDETITFDASASNDPDGTITEYAWDFNGDGKAEDATIDPITTHKYAIADTYNVTLTVRDDVQLTDATWQIITVSELTSSISISASPETIKVGENTTISGSITPARADKTVNIHYRLEGETTWESLANVTTNSDGEYSYVWTPEEAGTYEVKASWPGVENEILGAESSVITITVKKAAAPPPYLLYAAIVIVIVIVAAVAIYFLKIRKPKPTAT